MLAIKSYTFHVNCRWEISQQAGCSQLLSIFRTSVQPYHPYRQRQVHHLLTEESLCQ